MHVNVKCMCMQNACECEMYVHVTSEACSASVGPDRMLGNSSQMLTTRSLSFSPGADGSDQLALQQGPGMQTNAQPAELHVTMQPEHIITILIHGLPTNSRTAADRLLSQLSYKSLGSNIHTLSTLSVPLSSYMNFHTSAF
jgi:hypothetical protein